MSVHVRLTEATQNLIDTDTFAKMNKGTFLVNTSRGGVIDDRALLDALESGIIAGAALDVITPEPPYNLEPDSHSYDHVC